MNSTIFGVDPSNSTSLWFAYSNYVSVYKGQTTIIRFNMTLLDRLYYDISTILTSSIVADNYQIVRFFVSNLGVNFPCTSSDATVSYLNG